MSFIKSEAPYGKHLLDYKLKKIPRRTLLDKGDKVKSLHDTLGPVIVLGNLFSIFPISGIFSRNAENVRFLLYNPVTIYSIIVQCCFMTELVLLFLFLSRTGLKFFMVGQTIFTFVCIFGGTYFFYLALKWRKLMATWMNNERLFLGPPYSNKLKGNFSLKIQILAVVTITLSIIDHYIYFISAIEKVEYEINSCDESKRDFWRIVYVNDRQVFFMIFPYYSWQIPFLEWYEVVKTMCWTYSEVFVSAVSIILATRFKQLTNRLKFHKNQHFADSFWHEIREHYNVLCNLTDFADKFLSPVILVYSFSNLFFICQKIFTQFERDKRPWELYYSYYSSVFLISRTTAMLCFAASVNEKSRETIKVMREVSNKSYSGLDYHRLLDVIQANTVALSGCNFFYVTRGMILTLAGTIVTYELVLAQQVEDIASTGNVTTNACGEVLV